MVIAPQRTREGGGGRTEIRASRKGPAHRIDANPSAEEEKRKSWLGVFPRNAVLKAVIEHDSTEGKSGLTVSDLQPLLESKKLAALNRTSFKQITLKLFQYVGFAPEKQETILFVQCRNSLVHRGRFYATTATEEKPRGCPRLESLVEEYFFLANFLDRLFLKLLGYSGPYIDYRMPWNGGFGTERVI